jgi:hypothetical protein
VNATQDREALLDLFDALYDGAIMAVEHQRLQSRLAADAAARRLYFDYLDLRLHLRQWQRASLGQWQPADADAADAAPSGPIVIQTASPLNAPFALPYSLSGFALAYVAATLIVGIGLLVGWVYQVSFPQSLRQEIAAKAPRPAVTPVRADSEAVFVGQITGMVDCQWDNPHGAPVGFDRVALGRRYAMTSGLMEITYDSGAKIILQGPCTYKAESATGGYLSLGKVTALVETKGQERREKGEHRERFSVRTPTVTVADLGTEFGVEVDKLGASKAHVYRGQVELRLAGENEADNRKAIPLRENESARVEVGKDAVVKVVRQPGQPSGFVRQMPKRAPIKLFNTGVNLKAGDRDPHWQFVARSDDAKFQPQPAVVTKMDDPMYMTSQPDRSRWISGVPDAIMPDDVVYTFCTRFDLTGLRPSTAVLHGRFVADNRVQAIRLNGQALRVISHGHQEFGFLHAFSTQRGFVAGANVLEIDVENGDPSGRRVSSALGLLVELEGSAMSAWPAPADGAAAFNERQSKN